MVRYSTRLTTLLSCQTPPNYIALLPNFGWRHELNSLCQRRWSQTSLIHIDIDQLPRSKCRATCWHRLPWTILVRQWSGAVRDGTCRVHDSSASCTQKRQDQNLKFKHRYKKQITATKTATSVLFVLSWSAMRWCIMTPTLPDFAMWLPSNCSIQIDHLK